jgi:hypothetical protein
MFRRSRPDADAQAARLVPDDGAAREDVPVSVSVSAEVRRLDDIVSEAVKAEAVTRPSIAVLPFGNMSDDPENDYFSYGLTEDIIRLLARNRWLSVSRDTRPWRSRDERWTRAKSASSSASGM